MSTDSSRRAFLLQSSGALLAFGSGLLPAAAANSTLQVFYDPTVLKHEPTADHPESPKRAPAVMNAVHAIERQGRLSIGTPRPATEDQILLVHTRESVDRVRAEIMAGRRELSTGDTEISPGSFVAALAAAGTVTSAVDAVIGGGPRRAFCAVRPPGHHASQSRGMGFCLFNNIAIGARHARRRYGLERILIADWDVHHGNGTQAVFWNDGSVLFFDTHQHPWYPGTGSPDEQGDGKARGLIMNHPFPAGSGRREIVGVFRTDLVAAADRFRPQLVMVSAGFDSRLGDPLGQFTLNDADFAELTDVVIAIAERHAGGRIVSVLEGGYSLDGLARGVSAHLERLADAKGSPSASR
jgi:acetoin utilization deacetylase AcuC-like enzyme